LLASQFIAGGFDTARHAKDKAPIAEDTIRRMRSFAPFLPEDPVKVVRYDGAAKVVGGVAMAVGIFPRLAAAGLATSLVPTTWAAHRYWQHEDPSVRAQQKIQFLKNCGLLGGLLLAMVDTEGKPSLAYRAKRAPGRVQHAAHDASRDVPLAVKSRAKAAKKATKKAAKDAKKAARDRLPG
jgi:putative oxidoreductase